VTAAAAEQTPVHVPSLAHGHRLSDVIKEQVRRRVVEQHDVELKVIAHVSTSHRFGGDLSLHALQRIVGCNHSDLRVGLARLQDEQVVRINGDTVTGLLQLRSRALSEPHRRL
jgi:hypothetical protein